MQLGHGFSIWLGENGSLCKKSERGWGEGEVCRQKEAPRFLREG